MAWRWSGDKPLSEPMLIILPTHICVTRPQWVNHHFSNITHPLAHPRSRGRVMGVWYWIFYEEITRFLHHIVSSVEGSSTAWYDIVVHIQTVHSVHVMTQLSSWWKSQISCWFDAVAVAGQLICLFLSIVTSWKYILDHGDLFTKITDKKINCGHYQSFVIHIVGSIFVM